MIRVIIADDQPLIRGGIIMLLSGEVDIEVVGQANNGEEALAIASVQQPDLVIMDVRMPGLDGVSTTRQLTIEGQDPDHLVKVLILTTFDDDETVFAALRCGASGFLLKSSAPAYLLEAVRVVAGGGAWIDPATGGQLMLALRSGPRLGVPTSTRIARLTVRERQVLILIAQGMSNSEICAYLVLSQATVRTHVSRILMKTGCRDRSQAVALAYQSRLLEVDG